MPEKRRSPLKKPILGSYTQPPPKARRNAPLTPENGGYRKFEKTVGAACSMCMARLGIIRDLSVVSGAYLWPACGSFLWPAFGSFCGPPLAGGGLNATIRSRASVLACSSDAPGCGGTGVPWQGGWVKDTPGGRAGERYARAGGAYMVWMGHISGGWSIYMRLEHIYTVGSSTNDMSKITRIPEGVGFLYGI